MKLGRAIVVLVLSLWYLSHVFRLFDERFWTYGLGDWMDPYFINALLEHWHQSLWTIQDPSSPPMYFPARGTLGYSHGLILYAPAYAAVRPFLHPFQAHSITLLLVIEAGLVCLYLVFRKFHRLSFPEAVLLTAFFGTSVNVVGEATGVWSQRASVFLIPPILLLFLVAAQMPQGRSRLMLAWLSGLLATLLFTQDFYTGQLALLLASLGAIGYLIVGGRVRLVDRITNVWRRERSPAATAVFVTAALAVGWTCYVLMFGGATLHVLGVRITSHDWRRPALVAVVALAALAHLRGMPSPKAVFADVSPWLKAFALGGLVGAAVFLWIYLPGYLEHPGFPEDDLMTHLTARDLSRWRDPVNFLRDVAVYDSLRSFTLVFILGAAAWIPWLNVSRRSRICWLWFLFISLIVLALPLRFGDFSLWKTIIRPLPGFSAIRDPQRIIQVYELAVVLATALLLMQLPRRSLLRMAVPVLLLVLIVTDWNRTVFVFARPATVYDRWVAAPVDIDSTCTSFFSKAASDAYTARSADKLTLYGIDSLFVSLKHSIPTLNGYSAWSPDHWTVGSPEDPTYLEGVQRWVERHRLTGVCAFDIEARTMTPYVPPVQK